MLKPYLSTNIILFSLIPLTSVHASTYYQETVKNTAINSNDIIKNEHRVTTTQSRHWMINSVATPSLATNIASLKANDRVTRFLESATIENNHQRNNAVLIPSAQTITTASNNNIKVNGDSKSLKGHYLNIDHADDNSTLSISDGIDVHNQRHEQSYNYGTLLENHRDKSATINYDIQLGQIKVKSEGAMYNSGIAGITYNDGDDLIIQREIVGSIENEGTAINAAIANEGKKGRNIYITLHSCDKETKEDCTKDLIGSIHGGNYGIKSINSSGGGNFIKSDNLDMTSVTVGIYAENDHGGEIDIVSSGYIQAAEEAISAKATGTVKSNITISRSGNTISDNIGIYAENTSGGNITINNSKGGFIIGSNASSIMATNKASNDKSGKITTNNNGIIYGYVTYSGHKVQFNNQDNGEFQLYHSSDSEVTSSFGTDGNFLNNGMIRFWLPNYNKKATFKDVAEFTHNQTGTIDIRNDPSILYDSKDHVGQTITITNGGNGRFVSNGGSLRVNTYIDPINGKSDQLIVDNATTGSKGSTIVHIHPTTDSNYGKLTGDGIEIIKVKGSSSPDAFRLDAPVVHGDYEYGLVKGGSQSAHSWFLRNTYGYNPAIGGYLANMKAANNLFAHSLHDRAIASKTNLLSNTAMFQNLWLRTRIAHSHHHSVNHSFNNRDNTYLTQLGSDIGLWQVAQGNLHIGVMGGYGHYKNTSTSQQTGTQASSQMNGYNLGLYGSWFENDNGQLGTYIDAWSQYSWFRNRITGKGNISDAKKYNSSVWSNSIELGYGLSITKGQRYQIILTPQAQFTYNIHNMSSLYDNKSHLSVTDDKGSGLVSRLGARLYGLGIETNQMIQPYVSVDWINATAKNQLTFNGKHLKDDSTKNLIETKLGLVSYVSNHLSTSAQIGSQWGKDNYNQLQAQLTFNYNF
jgi:autotransporter family porin